MFSLSRKSAEQLRFFTQAMNNFSILEMHFSIHLKCSIACLNGFHMKNIFKLSWSWHFHQKPTKFHRIGPLGRFGLVVKCPSGGGGGLSYPLPMSFLRPLIGPQITWSFEVSKHSKEGLSSSSLAGWTHLRAASIVKWARCLLLFLDGHI